MFPDTAFLSFFLSQKNMMLVFESTRRFERVEIDQNEREKRCKLKKIK